MFSNLLQFLFGKNVGIVEDRYQMLRFRQVRYMQDGGEGGQHFHILQNLSAKQISNRG